MPNSCINKKLSQLNRKSLIEHGVLSSHEDKLILSHFYACDRPFFFFFLITFLLNVEVVGFQDVVGGRSFVAGLLIFGALVVLAVGLWYARCTRCWFNLFFGRSNVFGVQMSLCSV